MAEKCSAVAILNDENSSSPLPVGTEASINILSSFNSPYENTPLVSLNNSTTDLNEEETQNQVITPKTSTDDKITSIVDDDEEDEDDVKIEHNSISSTSSRSSSANSSRNDLLIVVCLPTHTGTEVSNIFINGDEEEEDEDVNIDEDISIDGSGTNSRDNECTKKVDIYLETPVVDDNIDDDGLIATTSKLFTDSAKPKRISDEFFSADDNEETNLCCNVDNIDEITTTPTTTTTSPVTVSDDNQHQHQQVLQQQQQQFCDVENINKQQNSVLVFNTNHNKHIRKSVSDNHNKLINNNNKSNIIKNCVYKLIEENEDSNLTSEQRNFLNVDDNSSGGGIGNIVKITKEDNDNNDDEDVDVDVETEVDMDDNFLLSSRMAVLKQDNNNASDNKNHNHSCNNINNNNLNINDNKNIPDDMAMFAKNYVQSMDAIERYDYEHEQKLTGGVIVKNSSILTKNKNLTIQILKAFTKKSNKCTNNKASTSSSSALSSISSTSTVTSVPASTITSSTKLLSGSSSKIRTNYNDMDTKTTIITTPTSSRSNIIRETKSTVKLNLSASLDRLSKHNDESELKLDINIIDNNSKFNNMHNVSNSNKINNLNNSKKNRKYYNNLMGDGESSSSQRTIFLKQQLEEYLNSNSNDSLSSDKSYSMSKMGPLDYDGTLENNVTLVGKLRNKLQEDEDDDDDDDDDEDFRGEDVKTFTAPSSSSILLGYKANGDSKKLTDIKNHRLMKTVENGNDDDEDNDDECNIDDLERNYTNKILSSSSTTSSTIASSSSKADKYYKNSMASTSSAASTCSASTSPNCQYSSSSSSSGSMAPMLVAITELHNGIQSSEMSASNSSRTSSKQSSNNINPNNSTSNNSLCNLHYTVEYNNITDDNNYATQPNCSISNNKNNRNDFPSSSSSFANMNNTEPCESAASTNKQQQSGNSLDITDLPSSSASLVLRNNNNRQQRFNGRRNSNMDDQILEPTQMSLSVDNDNEFDGDEWADCEDGSETEEICTCRVYFTDDEEEEEDELPSKEVDLSGYTHIDPITDDILQEQNTATDTTPRVHRKRKLTETRNIFGETYLNDATTPGSISRKRLALEMGSSSKIISSPSSSTLTVTSPTTITSPSLSEKRTPRSLIPTKDNPPPELCEWLLQFQRWSHAERLLSIESLIEHCEPTQVRHMMKVIEPQFQRDFISLLPKEVALQVLSYLEPKDLLRAAQTCRSWRFLCDDNLLWKEKCKKAGIIIESSTDKPKRGRAGNMPPISSQWKAAYMRQHIIEMNWRSRPIRKPKILKGHDDHVITCLQFCGNRIVSGSDDNTLKVWSAVTGKCLRTLVGHTGGVWSSQMSENIIISGSTDRTLKVWNAETGQSIHTLYGHTSTVRCMHLHGHKVVSGSRDATLRVWDINEGICLHMLVGHLAAVRCVQYDGKLVVSGAYDYMVKVWNPERQECLHTLQGHTNRVYSLQFDGVHVVSGSLDTSIRVWDAETGSCKHTLMGHQSLTSGMELRQNILVSGNADSTVKVWDIITGQCLQTLSGPNKHQSAVTCLQFNTKFVVTSSDDGTVKLWDVKTGDFIRNLVALDSGGSGGVVWRIRANDTKLICAVGSRNGTEETKLMVLDFDVEGACLKCS